MLRRPRVLLVGALLLLGRATGTLAQGMEDTGCAPQGALTVVSGEALNSLAGTPAQNISLYRYSNNQLQPVTVQVDQRDNKARYLLDGQTDLDANDELVFATADIGSRLPLDSFYRTDLELTEIQTGESASGSLGWLYVSPYKSRFSQLPQPLVTYSAADDSIETSVYRIGFSSATPFLVDTLQWNPGQNGQWGADLIDTMKIRHQGRLFGMMPFERSGKDYTSVLAGVKTGPLRVIRRTENRVRVFWQIKSPRLNIDYVMSPDNFVMDTVIEIPFSPGLFFSDLVTLTTVDWNPSPELPPMFLQSGDGMIRLSISGKPSAKQDEFNQSVDNRFQIQSRPGTITTLLDIPENVPIKSTLYLRDDIKSADPPEQFNGQFGNVGFKTTGWEDINTQVHHLKFSVCFSPGKPAGN